jgi:hypothetical protein
MELPVVPKSKNFHRLEYSCILPVPSVPLRSICPTREVMALELLIKTKDQQRSPQPLTVILNRGEGEQEVGFRQRFVFG